MIGRTDPYRRRNIGELPDLGILHEAELTGIGIVAEMAVFDEVMRTDFAIASESDIRHAGCR